MLKYMTSLLAILLMVASACSDRPSEIPSKDEMADILVDMHKLEAYWTVTDGPMGVKNDSIRKVMRQATLQKYGLTEQQFEAALKWYAHNIDDYVEVYDLVDKKFEKQLANASERSNAATMTGDIAVKDDDNLWQGLPVYALRKGSGRDGIRFELIAPSNINKGDILRWQMGSSPRRSTARLLLGVDYSDGTTSYVAHQHAPTERGNLFVNLQTDSALTIKRVYGVLTYNVDNGEVVLLDSISLSAHSNDRRDYQQISTQYKYRKDGNIKRKTEPKKAQPSDSLNNKGATSTSAKEIVPQAPQQAPPAPGPSNVNQNIVPISGMRTRN